MRSCLGEGEHSQLGQENWVVSLLSWFIRDKSPSTILGHLYTQLVHSESTGTPRGGTAIQVLWSLTPSGQDALFSAEMSLHLVFGRRCRNWRVKA